MTLADNFNTTAYKFSFYEKEPAVLWVETGNVSYRYDFGLRFMTGYGSQSVSVTPFPQLDRETLVALRDKLVSLGGMPPELPAETQTGPQKPRALNP